MTLSLSHWTVVNIAWYLLMSAADAEETRTADPLFLSNEIIDVRIVAPISTVLSERKFDEELPGKFHYTDSAGQAVELDIKIRARGRFRRNKHICRFPPIRLNFKTSQTKGTLFHKQDKLKLVTHCQRSSTYAQVLLREFTAYRILNVMTDASYRVRLLRITYVDTDGKRADDTRWGFVIEHKDRLAKRLNKSVLDIPKTTSASLNPEYANMISMYHLLIGNTDFSPIKGSTGDACCHNHVLFGNENEPVWSIPYDFDQAGLVNAPHAGPNPRLKLRNVRDRLYRGRCLRNDQINSTIAMYEEKREAIMQVLGELDVAKSGSVKSMTSYVKNFYKILGSERRVRNELVKKCI